MDSLRHLPTVLHVLSDTLPELRYGDLADLGAVGVQVPPPPPPPPQPVGPSVNVLLFL